MHKPIHSIMQNPHSITRYVEASRASIDFISYFKSKRVSKRERLLRVMNEGTISDNVLEIVMFFPIEL